MFDAWCAASHSRVAIVTNQPEGHDTSRPLYSVAVCEKPTCIGRAVKYVEENSHEPAVHVTDEWRRSR